MKHLSLFCLVSTESTTQTFNGSHRERRFGNFEDNLLLIAQGGLQGRHCQGISKAGWGCERPLW